MEIGLQTWGTEGDVRPFIALALGLKSAGHRVTLLTTEIRNRDFSTEARRFQLDIQPVGTIDCDDDRNPGPLFNPIRICNVASIDLGNHHPTESPPGMVILEHIRLSFESYCDNRASSYFVVYI